MDGLRLLTTALGLTMGRLRRQLLLLAGLALLCALLPFLAGQCAQSALSQGVSFSGITLAVTAPEEDSTPQLLEKYMGAMRDIRQYCRITAMEESAALEALADGSVTAVLALPEDFIGAVQRGENPSVRLIVDGRHPVESLLTLWVGQSAADLLSAVQAGIYGVLDIYDQADSPSLSHSQVVGEINLRYVQWTLNRQNLFTQRQILPTGSLSIALHYGLCLFFALTMSIAPLFSWNYQGAWLKGYRSLPRIGRSVLVGLAASVLTCAGLMSVFFSLLFFALSGESVSAVLTAALACGIFFSAYAALCALATDTSAGCGGLSFVFSLGALILSGGLIPPVLLPPILQQLSWLSPITWMRSAAAQAAGYASGAAFPPTAVLAALSVLLLAAAVPLYRRRCMQEDKP